MRTAGEGSGAPARAGDDEAEIIRTIEKWRELLRPYADGLAPASSFAIRLDDVGTVGRIVLVPVDAPRRGLGYWVAKTQQGKGFAIASLRTVTAYAASRGATDVDAEVAHGNAGSAWVLGKYGLFEVADFADCTRSRHAIDVGDNRLEGPDRRR